MTIEEMAELFEKHEDEESCQFERIPKARRKSQRPDLNGMLILDRLMPGTMPMVCSAEHDQIWFHDGGEKLAKVINESAIIDLLRCGIWWDGDIESLTSFV